MYPHKPWSPIRIILLRSSPPANPISRVPPVPLLETWEAKNLSNPLSSCAPFVAASRDEWVVMYPVQHQLRRVPSVPNLLGTGEL
jgi:hypothetical protein